MTYMSCDKTVFYIYAIRNTLPPPACPPHSSPFPLQIMEAFSNEISENMFLTPAREVISCLHTMRKRTDRHNAESVLREIAAASATLLGEEGPKKFNCHSSRQMVTNIKTRAHLETLGDMPYLPMSLNAPHSSPQCGLGWGIFARLHEKMVTMAEPYLKIRRHYSWNKFVNLHQNGFHLCHCLPWWDFCFSLWMQKLNGFKPWCFMWIEKRNFISRLQDLLELFSEQQMTIHIDAFCPWFISFFKDIYYVSTQNFERGVPSYLASRENLNENLLSCLQDSMTILHFLESSFNYCSFGKGANFNAIKKGWLNDQSITHNRRRLVVPTGGTHLYSKAEFDYDSWRAYSDRFHLHLKHFEPHKRLIREIYGRPIHYSGKLWRFSQKRIAAMMEYRGTLFRNLMSEFIAAFWILGVVTKDKGRLYGQVSSTFL